MPEIPARSVFVVVVTYNGREDISKCLSSLQASTISTQIVVIDNASTDDTVEIIHRNYLSVKIIQSTANLGFGKGNNIGIRYAYDSGAEHVFLLNQDAFVEPDAIETLVNFQCANNEYVLISPMQLDGSGKEIDSKFSKHISKSHSIARILSDTFFSGKMAKIYDVDYVNAAAWMLSRKCIEQVGLFNPIFDHYGEDCEYAHRVWQKRLKMGLCTQSIAYHNRDQNSSGSTRNWRKTLMMEKALIRYRLSRKNPGTPTNIMSSLVRALFANGQDGTKRYLIRMNLLWFIINGSYKTIKMRDK